MAYGTVDEALFIWYFDKINIATRLGQVYLKNSYKYNPPEVTLVWSLDIQAPSLHVNLLAMQTTTTTSQWAIVKKVKKQSLSYK